MKKALLMVLGAALFASVLALLGCASDNAAEASGAQGDANAPLFSSITAEEAKRMIDEGGVTIVDVRSESEYTEAHIPGAISIPFDEIGSNKLGVLPDYGERIIVYCRTGVQSKLAVGKLEDIGYTDVYDLGGIRDWSYATERSGPIG
ncbi:rhodanese-like domain-containing protein [Raoultibacter massiliensis]|uniref:Rhodanese-like domain-containing protein n=1 Tax=Raoultibacter massiliensis TaxID=1852371 RepID=A0ABV1JA96_9ACTN|nr:rhodanese-like domain-containing protein [Raoultibacter massiliensis]